MLQKKCNIVARIVGLFLILQVSVILAAACPGPTGQPRWRWDQIHWTYSGSYSTTGISNAAGIWNGHQSVSDIVQGPPYRDIEISDANNLDPMFAVTYIYTYAPTDSCYFKEDICGSYCYDTGMISWTEIKFDISRIEAIENDKSLSTNAVIEKVMLHEFGHIFGLANDEADYTCSSPTVMSEEELFDCPLSAPTSCDDSAVSNAYSGWNTFTYCGGCLTGVSC